MDIKILKECFIEMLDEMMYERLTVILVPSRHREIAIRGGMIRVAEQQNVYWYRQLCDRYQSTRRRKSFKSDTKIKRKRVMTIINNLINGKIPNSIYTDDIISIAEEKYNEIPF